MTNAAATATAAETSATCTARPAKRAKTATVAAANPAGFEDRPHRYLVADWTGAYLFLARDAGFGACVTGSNAYHKLSPTCSA